MRKSYIGVVNGYRDEVTIGKINHLNKEHEGRIPVADFLYSLRSVHKYDPILGVSADITPIERLEGILRGPAFVLEDKIVMIPKNWKKNI